MIELVQIFGLTFARILALAFVLPVLSMRQISMRMRIVFSLACAIVLVPVSRDFLTPVPPDVLGYLLAILGQLLFGALIGFMISIILTAFQIAGELFSMQMGTSFAEIMDPQANVSLPVLGLLKNSFAFLIFIALPFQMAGEYMPALHHALRVLAESIQAIPYFQLEWQAVGEGGLGESRTLGGVVATLDQTMRTLFLTAIQLALPLMGILFISSLVLGLFGRTAPQFNLVNIGGQMNIGLGVMLMIFLSPVFVPIILDSLINNLEDIRRMLADWPRSNPR